MKRDYEREREEDMGEHLLCMMMFSSSYPHVHDHIHQRFSSIFDFCGCFKSNFLINYGVRCRQEELIVSHFTMVK